MLNLETLISEDDIKKRTEELGKQISLDYEGKEIILLCILKGGVIFMADLARQISVPLKMEFMAVSSYGNEMVSSGVVKIIKDLDEPIENKHVLIVEDIIDTGRTLQYLKTLLESRKPASIKLCTLLDKPQKRVVNVDVDYVGFDIPDKYVIGYGLDCEQYQRNLPYVGIKID